MVSCATTIRKGLKFGIQFLLEITEKKGFNSLQYYNKEEYK